MFARVTVTSARRRCCFPSKRPAELHKAEQYRNDCGHLYGAKTHQISKRFYQSALFGDAIAEAGQHSLFESRIGFLLSESFFQNFVHSFGFLVSFSAGGALDEMRMQLLLLLIGEFAVKIGSEPVVDFVVNGCHRFSPLKRERGEVVCAAKPGRGREFRAAHHW